MRHFGVRGVNGGSTTQNLGEKKMICKDCAKPISQNSINAMSTPRNSVEQGQIGWSSWGLDFLCDECARIRLEDEKEANEN